MPAVARAGDPQPATRVRRHAAVRTLQIEGEGDFWKGVIKPKIRLMGRWLEQAGFKAGHRVQVICVAPGVMELRSHEAVRLSEVPLPSLPAATEPF